MNTTRILVVVNLFGLALCTPMVAGQHDVEEVLLILPHGREAGVAPAFPQLILYHRLPAGLLVGASRAVWKQLQTDGFAPELVSTTPWSHTYAVMTVRELDRFPTLPPQVQVLRRWEDHALVSGSSDVLETLRTRMIDVVELTRTPIPWSMGGATHLPVMDVNATDYTIAEIISRVADSSITAYIQGMQNFGTRYCMNANRDSVFSWVKHRFLETGIADVAFDSFQYSGTWQKNVVATIPGNVPGAGEIVIGGHFDSYSSNLQQAPGADDNASGTTAALEMARVLSAIGYQPALTLRFIGFAAEEVGLRGSAIYAQRARQQNRDIKVMLNYDMIGYRNQSQSDRDVFLVWYPGSEAHSDLHATMMRMYTTLTPVFTSSYRASSDSYSFYQQNYNTVFCIERDFSPYYHSPNDLLQYLEIPYAREVIQSGLAMLLTLDQMPPMVPDVSVRDRGTGTALMVSWDSVLVPDFHRYKVQVGTSPGVYTNSYLQTERSHLITGLTEGTLYYVGVSILDLAGREGLVHEVSMVPRLIPLSPSGLTAEGLVHGVQLEWLPNEEMDLHGYNVYRAAVPTESFVRLNANPIVGTSWMDSLVTVASLYFITAVDSSGNESAPSDTVQGTPLVGVAGNSGHPVRFRLLQNYPNPFNPTTTLRFELPVRTRVQMVVYDLLAREVAVLMDDIRDAGVHTIVWNATGLPSGSYVCQIRAGKWRDARLMALVR